MSRILLLAGIVLAIGSGPAAAQSARGGFDITSFDVHITVNEDASLRIRESLMVDFGRQRFRGIFRFIPMVYDLPADTTLAMPDGESPDTWARVLEIEDIEVTSTSGAPTATLVSRPDPARPPILNAGSDPWNLSIRIGDEDTYIRGLHQYTILYTVRGAFNEFDNHAELYWNVTGNDWLVPIHATAATVSAPGIDAVTCFAGRFGATSPCSAVDHDGKVARFSAQRLATGEGMTVVVALASNALTVGDPLLVKRWTFLGALGGSAAAIPLAVLTSIIAFGGVAMLLWRQGRDRVAIGGASSHGTLGTATAPERRLGLFEPRPVPVEYRPPDDLRPAEIGLLHDETVDPVDISATIVDLAVAGHLRIEEIESGLIWKKADWRLIKLEPPASSRPLKDWEQRLLDGLFGTGDSIRVSDLKGVFATDYQAAERMLYQDAVSRGWFRKRPDSVRSTWLGLGILALLASIGLFVLGLIFTRFAAAAIPFVLGSLALAIGHRHMPHRTSRGSALLIRALGFREFIERAETERMKFAERENIFLDYLPYAVMFGLADKWAEAFQDVGVEIEAQVGHFWAGHRPFAIDHFAHGMNEFGHHVGTSLATVPSSSGSGSGGFSGGGFSGGGFGGGGGGGW
ncbi:MAG: DUF2207 domain-containing protein [Nitriliruptorales bacterium]|nr:DUF2207 domain-containing protein [Nitriliruptorales bacterium]